MTAFTAAIDMLFADPNIGREAVYIADGGAPVLVRVVPRQADAITDFGDARLWSETTRIDLRVAEVAAPRPGDRIKIDGCRRVLSSLEPVHRALEGV
ncbi:hypothetical protein VSX64_19615 [Aurantimonas sp. C2-6-R+9]|uniref:head-tail joining protein n=1 Tax=unclassified Aurantimonas TaxID=2638230 RepID=UPI002E198094|nr:MULTISPECIES: hypothetical protein [unclassified Aurantimonas]MEC5292821.1 hypothetical protein [Aurantimonas sp. C2-3-R2]MEC5383045.1 hypothetical protein [Aurantimonas sp. C2-6-R+9]MEC5413899.1 hypothetical protein [Aurantimonas sp. C2-4-R8]